MLSDDVSEISEKIHVVADNITINSENIRRVAGHVANISDHVANNSDHIDHNYVKIHLIDDHVDNVKVSLLVRESKHMPYFLKFFHPLTTFPTFFPIQNINYCIRF